MHFPSYKNEKEWLSRGYHYVAGCDEVGVSPLAGPVVAAVCILDPESIGKQRSKKKWYYRVRDSKTTNEDERQILLPEILKNTLAFGVGEVWPKDIDEINIHHATRKAMRLATEQMLEKIKNAQLKKVMLFIDGRFKIPIPPIENIELTQTVLVKGDTKVLSISAASIIAKVHRDNIMHEYDKKFPEYGFAKHKGYGTKFHYSAIRNFGPTELHRRSFLKKIPQLDPSQPTRA